MVSNLVETGLLPVGKFLICIDSSKLDTFSQNNPAGGAVSEAPVTTTATTNLGKYIPLKSVLQDAFNTAQRSGDVDSVIVELPKFPIVALRSTRMGAIGPVRIVG